MQKDKIQEECLDAMHVTVKAHLHREPQVLLAIGKLFLTSGSLDTGAM